MHCKFVHIVQNIMLPDVDGVEFIRGLQENGYRPDSFAPETACHADIRGHELSVLYLKALSKDQTVLATYLSKTTGVIRYVDADSIANLDIFADGLSNILSGSHFIPMGGSTFIVCDEQPNLAAVANKLGFVEAVKNVFVLDKRGLSFTFSNHVHDRVIQATVDSDESIDGPVGTKTVIAFGNRLRTELSSSNSLYGTF